MLDWGAVMQDMAQQMAREWTRPEDVQQAPEHKGPWLVMRHPCLPEDEGRHFPIKVYVEKEAAKAWIEAQKGEYFSPGDYYIVEVEG